jgi:hypothetical protein
LNISQTFPIHVIFLAIFPVIFLFSENMHEFIPADMIIPLLIIIPITLIVFFILTLILKDSKKAALIVSIGLVLFFTYGHFYNIIKGFTILDQDIGRHRYIIIPFILGIIIPTYFIIKNKIDFQNITKIVNGISIALVIMVLVNITMFTITEIESYSTIYYEPNDNLIELQNIYNTPDVYYIILDEYGGPESMKYLNYDNSQFYKFLKEKKFIIPEKSTSNYPMTHFSVPSSMNMEYVNDLSNILGKDSKTYLPLREMLYNSQVIKNFKNLGYDIVIFESGFVPSKNFVLVDDIVCHEEDQIDSILFDSITKISMIGYFVERHEEEKIRDRVNCAFSEIKSIGNNKDEPIFAFVHILMPHPPNVFGPNGEAVIPGNPISSEIWDEKIAYLDQVKFANKEIVKVIEKILDENEKSIIIIQSDHGSGFDIDWKNPDESMILQRLSILNAYYVPEISENEFYENITPVNSFRIIFNNYFNGNYKILEDRNYWNNGFTPFDFEDVTEIINMKIKQ